MIEEAYKKILTDVAKIDAKPAFCVSFPGVCYKVTPIQGGTIRKDQLEVRIMGDDFDELSLIRDAIIQKLDMDDSAPSLAQDDYVIRSKLAGGGWLFNTESQKWELYPIFTTTWRYKHE